MPVLLKLVPPLLKLMPALLKLKLGLLERVPVLLEFVAVPLRLEKASGGGSVLCLDIEAITADFWQSGWGEMRMRIRK